MHKITIYTVKLGKKTLFSCATELEAHFIARRRGLHGYKVVPESAETWDSAAEFEADTLKNHGYN